MANWYVRESGGTTAQCTGHTDANYPGSGTGQACAYATVQDAINASTFGDTIYLEAGGTFVTGGNALTDKGAGTDYIKITTNGTSPAFLDSYPDDYVNGTYTRVTPAMAATMPKIVTDGAGTGLAAFRFSNDAHHWWIDGLEITNDVTTYQTALIGDSSTGHHDIKITHCWLHPQEEDGTDSNIVYRSVNHAIFINGDNFTISNNAVTGITGHALGSSFRLEASCIITVSLTNSLIENNLFEVNGQLFIGGGGGTVPSHTANATGTWTFTSGTLDSTTDLDVGDVIAIHNLEYASNHLEPNDQDNPTNYGPISAYQNGRILTINHGTGAITFTPLTSSCRYRQFMLYLFNATGGSYTLTWMGQTTSAIAWNADKAAIYSALEALSNVAVGDVYIVNNIPVGSGGDGWPYSDFAINFEVGHDGTTPGAWAYPTPVNPLTITSSLTGGSAAGYVGAHASESYTPSENSQDGTTWTDIPQAGDDVSWKGTQAHDVTVRRNIIAKRHIWTSTTGDVKGFIEQKGCSPGCSYDANIFTGRATGFVFTVRNQGGSVPWASNSYTEFTNNIFDEGGGTFAIANTDGVYELDEPSHDLLVHNNLVLDPGGYFNESKPLILATGGYNITITHNTMFGDWWIFTGVGYIPITSGLTIQDNVFFWKNYSNPCSDIPGCWPSYTVSNNLLANLNAMGNSVAWFSDFGGAGAAWEELDHSPAIFTALSATLDGDGFSKLTIGDGSDYTIHASSVYKAGGSRDATDSTDLGVNFPALITALGYNPFTGGAPPEPPAPTTSVKLIAISM